MSAVKSCSWTASPRVDLEGRTLKAVLVKVVGVRTVTQFASVVKNIPCLEDLPDRAISQSK